MARKTRPLWFRFLRGFVLIYLGLCLFSWTLVDRLIFFPPQPSYGPDAPSLIYFDTPSGERIAAFFHPPQEGQPTLLYSHGNAEDIGHSIGLTSEWRRHGLGVLAYDYPGYGHSSGRPTEASCQRAISAAWQYLRHEEEIPAEKIVVVGRSVGSGPSVYLAAKHSPVALILISPFTSTFAVRAPAQHILPGNRFPNRSRLKSSTTRLLIIHGDQDRVIPVSHGRRLLAASQASDKQLIVVPGVGHNNLSHSALVDPIVGFLEERN